MRATGIVRRIDELGRIVIPKEIRRQMGIEAGAPLEFFIDEQANVLCFTPYLPNIVTTLEKGYDIKISENVKCY